MVTAMPVPTADALYLALTTAGFSPDQAVTMTAIALAESRGSAPTGGGEDSRGLWQINADPSSAEGPELDLAAQAQAAFEASGRGRDLSPWTTTHGTSTYAPWLPVARGVAVTVGDLPPVGAGWARVVPAVASAAALLAVVVGVVWLLQRPGSEQEDRTGAVAMSSATASGTTTGGPTTTSAASGAVSPLPSPAGSLVAAADVAAPTRATPPAASDPPSGTSEEEQDPPAPSSPASRDLTVAVAAPVVTGVRAVRTPGSVCGQAWSLAVLASVTGDVERATARWFSVTASGELTLAPGPRGWAGTIVDLPHGERVSLVVEASGSGGSGEGQRQTVSGSC